MDLQGAWTWLRRLARFDLSVFEEIRQEPGATIPAVLVASAAMLLSGLGGWLWWVVKDYPTVDDAPLPATGILIHSGLIGAALATVLWGVIWVVIVYAVLTRVYGHRAYVEQLLRVMGFAAAPIGLAGVMFIPGVSLAIGIASLGLAVALTHVAVKSATGAEDGEVVAANLLGFAVWCGALTLLATAAEPHAPGVFLFNSVSRIADSVFG